MREREREREKERGRESKLENTPMKIVKLSRLDGGIDSGIDDSAPNANSLAK